MWWHILDNNPSIFYQSNPKSSCIANLDQVHIQHHLRKKIFNPFKLAHAVQVLVPINSLKQSTQKFFKNKESKSHTTVNATLDR